MERRRRNGCLIVLKLLLVPLVSVYSQSFVYEGCSQEIYTEDSTYDNNLQSLLGTLVSQASNTKYYNISLDTSGNDAVYGLYQCRGDLGGRDCQNCIRNAQRQIAQVCVRTRGARIQMDGCSLHYDKTGGFIGGNGFRLSNSGDSRTGYVHGLAQCEGDLSLTDCGTCMAAAVQRLRDVCGNAVSGQVYLSKCYARYSQDAFYRDNSSSDHHHDDNDDDAGKTVAIILGLLAGVALIVVFLSFLKQILKHGKG
ncbi:hypothetical protein SUGI_0221210 [Cryptomeria japonica]|nr:hypothetical protein SUGI_0221210 [Cryptomeria japonica]